MSACVAPLPALAALKQDGPVALFIQSSEGVHVLRDGQKFSAKAGHVLKLGDRVMVRQGASAQAVFQEQEGQVVLGRFDSGCDASLVYFSRKKESCSVVFDVVSGKVELALKPLGEGLDEEARDTKRQTVGFHCYSKPTGW
ncbi:MAG: hypothetical protein LBE51_09255 [Acidovorax sp.]|nr:hypothetical protein [Acidovorax sp.]MDR3003432.1 hypothetical protein [Acidovorax sp.]